jgi:undecaprenyl-diphosphatase
MLLVEWIYRKKGEKRVRLGLGDAFVIGAAQMLALFPGVSRSGITILTGMSRGLEREKAARFSFLISLPIVFAAGLWELFSVYESGALAGEWPGLGVGILTSFVVGLLAVKFLLVILRRFSLVPFAVYRILLGVFLLLTL